MNWRLLFCLFVAGLLPLITVADTLIVAGNTQRISTPLITKGDDVLAPVLASLRLLGAQVTINHSAITITTSDRVIIHMTLDSTRAMVGDKRVTLPAAPCLVGDNIYLPVKWLTPFLHASCRFSNGGQTFSWQPMLDVSYEDIPQGQRVLVRADSELQFHYRLQPDGSAAVIDFKNTVFNEKSRQILVNVGRLARIRLSQYRQSPATVRMSLDFSAPSIITPTIGEDGHLLTILVSPMQTPLIVPTTFSTTARVLPPLKPLAPAKLLTLTLSKHSTRQSLLTINTDGPTSVASNYDAQTHQLTLAVANGVNTLDAAPIRALQDDLVRTVGARANGAAPGATISICLKQDAGYFVEQEAKDIRVFIGSLDISDMTIVLDPGHGDKDTGAIGVDGYMEKTANLAVALRAAQTLRAAGAKVLLTREDDTFIPLDDRPALANENQASIFISIHCNSTPTPNSANGTQTYYHFPQSATLAAAMHKALTEQLGLMNGGVHLANFLVLRKCEMPAILIELAFINNTNEEALLASPDFQQKAAYAILEGVRAYAASKDWQLHKQQIYDPLPAPSTEIPSGEVPPSDRLMR